MALPELLDALRSQAAERRAEEFARATAEAERIRAESRASLEARRAEQVERTILDANEAARSSISEARSRAAESILRARDRLLGRVRMALGARARTSIDEADLRAALADLLPGALVRLPAGQVTVRARPELTGALAEAARNAARDVVFDPVPGMAAGFIAVSSDSDVEIDATLETMLEHRWPAIAVTVLAEVGR